jgi:hypothetical protein
MLETDLPRREALRWSIKTLAGLGVFVAASTQLESEAKAAGRHSDPDFCPPICYRKGTQIEISRGTCAIEDLNIGDEVVTHRGGLAKVKWIGRMSYAKGPSGWNRQTKPVLFRRSSLGENIPNRDLYVSQQHAMLVDDVFIPAKYLVNGASIEIVTPPENDLHYFQIELEGHEAVFANGAPSESFFATPLRERFANYPEYLTLYGAAPMEKMTPYRPIHRYSSILSKLGALTHAFLQRLGVDVADPVLRARAKLSLRARQIAPAPAVAARHVLLPVAAKLGRT